MTDQNTVTIPVGTFNHALGNLHVTSGRDGKVRIQFEPDREFPITGTEAQPTTVKDLYWEFQFNPRENSKRFGQIIPMPTGTTWNRDHESP